MLEQLLAPGFFYNIIKDSWAFYRRGKRRLTEEQKLAARKRWSEEIDQKLLEHRKRTGHGIDIIVRDLQRIDRYPDIQDKAKGISPWFKCGLMGTYHRGVLFGLQWYGMKQKASGKWRLADYKKQEQADLNAIMIGQVKYENIEEIFWNGDEFNNEPHFYCHFIERNAQPYEKIVFYRKQETQHGIPFYTELGSYKDIVRESVKSGVKW